MRRTATLAYLCLVLMGVGCPADEPAPTQDAAVAVAGPVGFLSNCTPGEDRCQEGLRCALVQVGEIPYQGYLTQCVPYAAEGLPEDARCEIDRELMVPAGVERRFADRCGPGLGCVPTAFRGSRCRPLCALRVGGCAKGRYCVVPSPVSAVGTCEPPDGCQAPPPQLGCPVAVNGVAVGCYALGDQSGGGTYCLPRRMLGNSDGKLGAPCERAVDCAAGLGCATVGENTVCRPYCELPALDGGVGDGGARDLGNPRCSDDLGTCQSIAQVARVGRCL